jgi:hypothetical protein
MKKILFLPAALFVLCSCAAMMGKSLRTVPVEENPDIMGLFTTIFYGRHYAEEADAVVIMDLEGDEYTFVPKGRIMDFETLKRVTAREALYESEPFFNLHAAYSGISAIRRILSPDGRTIGYEIRPFYHPTYYGKEDVVMPEYRMTKEGKVYFKVNLSFWHR